MQFEFLILCLTIGSIFGSQDPKFDNALHPARIVEQQNQEQKEDFSASQNFLYYKQFDLKLKELQQLLMLLKLQSINQKSGFRIIFIYFFSGTTGNSQDRVASTTSTSTTSTTTSSMTEMKNEEQSKLRTYFFLFMYFFLKFSFKFFFPKFLFKFFLF